MPGGFSTIKQADPQEESVSPTSKHWKGALDVGFLSFMARRASKKSYFIQWHQTAAPHVVSRETWIRFVSDRLAIQIEKYVAVVCEGVTATLNNGKLSLSLAPSPYIRNSWRQWEVAWMYAMTKMPAHVALMSLFARQDYAMRERQDALDADAFLWEWKRRGRNVDVK